MVVSYKSLAKELPKEVFKPHALRVFTLIFLIVTWVGAFAAIAMLPMAWPFKLILGLVIGQCWAMTSFIGHEILHGAVVRGRTVQDFLGFFAFFPLMIGPTFWRYWHNNLHHSHTQRLIQDPDAFPTYRVFKHSKFIQRMYGFTPGSGKLRSYLYFFFWFSLNVHVAQFYFRFRNRIFDKLNNRRVTLEALLIFVIAGGLLAFAGPANWLWAAVIPFVVLNYTVHSYISTNHNLSPLTKDNDPLENSLTVTNNPVLEALHLNFGYHVEHHLFPSMNSVHLKKVHRLLKEKYPDRYQCMPKWEAIKALYKTARIYKSSTVLMNPYTKATYGTLGHPLPVKEDRPPVSTSGSEVVPPEHLAAGPVQPQV